MIKTIILLLSFILTNNIYAQLSDLEKAEELFNKNKYDEALIIFNKIINNPLIAPHEMAISQCRMGIIKSIKNDPENAIILLEKSLQTNIIPEKQISFCNYALLQLYVMKNMYTEAKTLILKMSEITLPPTYIIRTYALATKIAQKLQDNKLEQTNLNKLLFNMEKYKQNNVILKVLNNKVITLEEIKKRINKEEKEPLINKTEIPLNILNTPTITNVSEISNNSQTNNSKENNLVAKNIQKLIKNRNDILAKDNIKTIRIGIVLTSLPTFNKYNHKILRGVSTFLNSIAINNVNYSVEIETTNNTLGSIEKATNKLLFNKAVHAIIGPLHILQAYIIAQNAQIVNVPVFAVGPVAFTEELKFNNLIRLGILSKSQSIFINNYLKDKNISKIGIFSPADPFGVEMNKALTNEINDSQIKISRNNYYQTTNDNLKEDVLFALGQGTSIEEQSNLVAKIKKNAKNKDNNFEVKYDADILFLPENLNKAKIIASTFAFYGAEKIKYIGDKSWQEGIVNKPSMVDNFINSTLIPNPEIGSFTNYIKKDLLTTIENIDIEKQTFDALIFIRQAHYLAASNDNEKLLNTLLNTKFSANGTIKYGNIDKNGEPLVNFNPLFYYDGKLTTER